MRKLLDRKMFRLFFKKLIVNTYYRHLSHHTHIQTTMYCMETN